jgi:hypothetical protein
VFTRKEMFADPAAVGVLSMRPTTEEELLPSLDKLEELKVILFDPCSTRTSRTSDRARAR